MTIKKYAIPIFVFIIIISAIIIGISIHTNPNKLSHRYAVILNLTNDFPQTKDAPAFPAEAIQAYWAIKTFNVPDENIYLFLNLDTLQYIDYDYNGTNDLSNVSIDYLDDQISWGAVYDLFNTLAKKLTNEDELVIYATTHGYILNSTFAAMRGNDFLIFENEFKDMIDKITVRKMVLILDFCYAGNFASNLLASNRIIISSVTNNEEMWCYWNWGNYLAYNNMNNMLEMFGDSGTVFSHPFWNAIIKNNTLIDAFNYANSSFRNWTIVSKESQYIVNGMHPFIKIGSNVTNLISLYDYDCK